MDRMHIKRLLTICLALMLSVSMLPAGTFAETEAAAGEQKQTTTEPAENPGSSAAEEAGQPADTDTDVKDAETAQPEEAVPEVLPEEKTTEPEAKPEAEAPTVKEEPADEDKAGKTDNKKEEKDEAKKLGKISFADFLTSDTGVCYLPEGAEDDDWKPLDKDTKLDPEEKVLLHIAYEIPAGKIDETNAETEYVLPEGLNLSDDEVKAANKDGAVYEGKDRKADDLRKAGNFEIKDGKALITFSKDTCEKNSGEKADKIEGFFEIEVSASDLLRLKKADGTDNGYKVEWNKEEKLDSVVAFDAEKIADADKKNEDIAEEKSEEAKTEEPADETEATPQMKVAASLKKGIQMVLLAAGSGPSASGQSGSGNYNGIDYEWNFQWLNTVGDNYSYEDDGTLLIHPMSWIYSTADLKISLSFNDVEHTGQEFAPAFQGEFHRHDYAAAQQNAGRRRRETRPQRDRRPSGRRCPCRQKPRQRRSRPAPAAPTARR